MKYDKLIKLGGLEKRDLDIPYELKRAKMEAKLEVVKLEKLLAEEKQKLSKSKMAVPISFCSIRDCMNAVQMTERKLKQTLALEKELF